MSSNAFVGTWRLVSSDLSTTDGRILYPFGEDAVGCAIYTEHGHFSISIMKTSRPKTAYQDFGLASVEEKAATVDGYLSYAGMYEVKQDKVLHHVGLSLYPNWVGVTQERLFCFDDDRLSLCTNPILILGVEFIGRAVWERV